jgi:hypothetical protein
VKERLQSQTGHGWACSKDIVEAEEWIAAARYSSTEEDAGSRSIGSEAESVGFWDDGVRSCGEGRYLRDKEDKGSIVEAVWIWKKWGPIRRYSEGGGNEALGRLEIEILDEGLEADVAKVIGTLWAEMVAGQTACFATLLGCRYRASVHGTPSTVVKKLETAGKLIASAALWPESASVCA